MGQVTVHMDTKNNLSIAIKPKPPFRPVFQVAASRKGSDIRILNEPLNGSSVFLVETGEGRSPSYPPFQRLIRERRALKVIFSAESRWS